jgi:hypothetical protein
VALNVPGVTLSGTLGVKVNNTGSAVDETFTIAGVTTNLVLPGGASYVRVEGTDLALNVLGQRISGDFAFEQITTTSTVPQRVVRVSASDVNVALGDGTRDFVRVENGEGNFLLTAAGVAGEFSGDVILDIPGVSFTGSFAVRVKTITGAVDETFTTASGTDQLEFTDPDELGEFFRIEATGVTLVVAGQTLTGNFAIEQSERAGPNGVFEADGVATDDEKVVTIGITNLALTITDGATNFVVVTSGNGALRIDRLGVAAQFIVTGFTFNIPGIEIDADEIQLEINTSPEAVNEVVKVGNSDVPLVLPAGSFIRVAVIDVDVEIGTGGGGPVLHGDFFFDQGTRKEYAPGQDLGALSGATSSVAVGDVNGDGRADLIIGRNGATSLLFLNNGTANPFNAVAGTNISATIFNTTSVALADVNGDNKLDLIVGNNDVAGDEENLIYLNNGTANPFNAVTPLELEAAAYPTVALAVADFNGDGRNDIVIGNDGTANLLYLNNGTSDPFGGVTGLVIDPALRTTTALAVGDMDGDGRKDLIAGFNLAETRIYLNRYVAATDDTPQSGQMDSSEVLLVGDGLDVTTALAVGDLDKDGDEDLVVGRNGQTNRVYLSTGGIDPFDGVTPFDLDAATLATSAIALSDVDGDGKLDVVVAVDGGQKRVYLNAFVSKEDEENPFAGVTATLVGGASDATTAIVLVDFDGDGDLDLVSGNDGAVNQVFLNGIKVTRFAVANVTVEISGQGLKNGEGAFVIRGAGIAGFMSGEVALGGGGFDLGGNIGFRINNTGGAVNETIELNGKTISIVFAADQAATFFGSDLTLNIGNFVTIEGSAVVFDGGGNFSGSGLTIFLGQGPLYIDASADPKVVNPAARGVLLKDAAAGIKKVGANYIVYAEGTVELLGIPGVTFSGDAVVRFNNTGAGGSVVIPGTPDRTINFTGDETSFSGSLTLAVAGQSIGGTFSFEQLTLPGPTPALTDDIRVIKVGITNGELALGDGDTDFVTLTEGRGGFILTNAGIAGDFSVTVGLNVPGAVDFDGTFRVMINNTTTEVSEDIDANGETIELRLPAGPYLKVEGGAAPNQPIVMTVFGQTLSGRFAFEQYNGPSSPQSPGAPQKLVRIAITDLEFHLQADGQDIVSLTEGQGFFVIKPSGLAGRVSGTFSVAPSLGIEVSGTVGLAFSNSTTAVSEQFTVGTQTVALNLPAGPYLRLEGTNMNLRIAGQRVSGNFAFEKSTAAGTTPTTVVRVIATNVNVALGDGSTDFLTLTNGSAVLLLQQSGVAGRLGGTIGVNIPGVSLGGTFTVAINNTNTPIDDVEFEIADGETETLNLQAGPYVRVEGEDVYLIILEQKLSGNFVFEQLTRNNGQRVVRLALTEGTLALGGTPSSPLVEVTDGTGKLLLTPAGLAGEFGGTLSVNIDPSIQFTGALNVAINNTNAPVNEDFVVAGERINLSLPAGPYLRVEIGNASAPASLSVLGQTLSGNFAFEQVTTAAGLKRVRVAATNVGLSLGGVVEVVDGEGSFLISPDGLAGSLAATVNLDVPAGIEFVGRFGLSINKTSRSVNEQFEVGGRTIFLNLPAGPYIRVEGTGVQLNVAGQTLSGDFAFEQSSTTNPTTGVTRSATRVVAQNVSLRLGGGGTDVVVLTNGRGSFLMTNEGIAGEIAATVTLNIPGVQFAGTFRLAINNTGTAVDEEFSVTVVNGGTILTSLNGGRGIGAGLTLTASAAAPSNGQFVNPVAAALDPTAALISPVLFVFELNGEATSVVLTSDAQGDNATAADLVTDLNAALVAAGIGTRLQAELVSNKIRFNVIDATVRSISLNARFGLFTATRTLTATLDAPVDGKYVDGSSVVTSVSLSLNVNGETIEVLLSDTAQDDNDDLSDLVDDFNTALATAGLASRVASESIGGRVRFLALLDTVTTLEVVASTVPGFAGTEVAPTPAVFTVTSGAELPATGIFLDGDSQPADFEFVVWRGDTATTVTVSIAAQSDNTSPADFVSDLSDALTTAGLTDITAELIGNQLQLVSADGFALAVADATGFSEDQANDPHLRVMRRDGVTFDVNLASATTLDDVVRLINQAAAPTNGAGGVVTASLDGAQFKIVDTGTAAGSLTVVGLDEFTAADDLGLTEAAEATMSAGEILGATLTTVPPITLQLPKGPYVRVEGTDISLTIAGQTLSGDFSFEQVQKAPGQKVIKIAIANAELHLGDGTTDFVVVSAGTGSFLVTPAGLAGQLSAELEVKLPGIDVDGKVTVAINNTNAAVNELFTIGSGADAIEINLALPAGPYVRVEVAGRNVGEPATLTVLGQTLTGNFAFEQVTNAAGQRVVRIGVSQVGLRIGDGSNDFVVLSDGNGAFVLTPAGMAGRIEATVSIPLIGFSGTLGLAINNTTARVNERILVNGETLVVDLPAGPYLRVEGTNISLSIAGQSLSGDFSFERSTSTPTTGGAARTVVRVAAANVSLRLGNGTTDFVRVSDGRGALLITPAGLAGTISATVELNVPGVTFSGRFGIDINNTNAAVNEMFTVGGVELTTVLSALHGGDGVDLGGDGADFRITRRDGVTLDVDLDGTSTVTDVLVRINNAVGNQDGKLVATLEGTRLKLVDSSTKVGANVLTVVSLNDTTTAEGLGLTVTASSAGGADTLTGDALNTIVLALDAGPYLKVSGTDVTLELLGQRIRGDFAFEKITSRNPQTNVTSQVIRVVARNVEISLGDGTTEFVSVTNGSGSLIITSAGLAGEFGASVEVKNIPDVSFSGTFKVQINNTNAAVNATFDGINPGDEPTVLDLPRGPYLSIAGDDVTLEIAGVGLEGNFVFEQMTTASGQKVIRVAATDVGFSLRSGDDELVRITGASGSLLITPQGIAASLKFRIAPDTFQIRDFTMPLSIDLGIEINNTRAAVDQTFTVGGETIRMKLPAGPFLRVTAYNIEVPISNGVVLKGDFLFEQLTRQPGNQRIIRIAVANLEISGVPNDPNQVLQDGQGALVIKKVGARTGIAGVISGTAKFAVGGVSVGGTLGFRINTTRAAVDERVDVNGTVIAVLFTQQESQNGNVFELLITNLKINIADFVTIEGNVKFGNSSYGVPNVTGSFAGEGLSIFLGQGPVLLENGEPNPEAIGVMLTDADIALLQFTGGRYAFQAEGAVRLVGLDGLNVSGTARIRINNSGSNVPRITFTFDGDPSKDLVMESITDGTIDYSGTLLLFSVTDVLEISGAVQFSKKPNGTIQVGISGASVKVWVPDQTEPAFTVGATAFFTIGGAEGFRLQSIQVNNFSIFGQGSGLSAASGAPAPIQFLTADLAAPYGGQIVDRADLNSKHYIDVLFEDPNKRGIKEITLTDDAPEFTVTVNGAPAGGITFGRPVKQGRYWRYSFTGNFPQDGEVAVTFVQQAWTDNGGIGNFAETEIFTLVTKTPDGKFPILGPTGTLTNPGSGATVTADSLNAKKYIDVTFITRSDSPIDPASINGDEFGLSGPGVADVEFISGTNKPALVTAPILISGTTYRYFLKDKNTTNALSLFQAGEVEVQFLTGIQGGFKTQDNRANVAISSRFTVEPNAPGAATGTGPLALGPLTLQGPTVEIADVGFKSGKLVLTIGIGVNRASLAFGGSSPAGHHHDDFDAAERTAA